MIGEIFLRDFSLSSCVLQSTIFLVVGLVVSFILRHRSSRAHQVLFLAMMAAVIVPIMSILVKHYELGMFVAEPVVIQSSAKNLGRVGNFGAPGIISAENIEHNLNPIERDLPSAMAGSESAKLPWRSVVLGGWIAASLILAARLLVTFVLGVRILGKALPLNCEKIEEAAHLARAKLGIDKDVKVHSSRGVRSPVIWCWRRRPVLLVPSEAGRFDNGLDWAGVLCHELAHWKRWDHICGLLAELVVCILPWHPLLWWAKFRLVSLSEQACDDWVVASGQPGTDYAESLLDLTPGGQMAFVPAVVSSKRGLAYRIRRILKDNCSNPRTGVVWALAVSIMAACLAVGVACAQTRPAKPQTATEHEAKYTEAMIKAAADGDIEQVKLLISKGADVNAKNQDGRTPLDVAAGRGDKDMAALLIANSADINTKNRWGSTPLHVAAKSARRDVAELLIDKGADIREGNRWGATPLHVAASSDHAEVARLLLDKGADVNARAKYDTTPLHDAVGKGHKDMVELLLANGADINARIRELSVVNKTMMAGQKEMVRFLIAKGVDVSPINVAAYFGELHDLKKCIAGGSNINSKDTSGFTPLHCAVCGRQKHIAEFLISVGADVNSKDAFGRSVLQFACGREPTGIDLGKLLIAKGADVNHKDQIGETALHWIVNRGDKEFIELLLRHGANVNAKATTSRDWEGWTPFHVACRRGKKAIVEMLLAKGAQVNAKTDEGYTPVSLAKEYDHQEIVELLRKHGAKE